MRERWDEAINNIDEKYINETAQAHAKRVKQQSEQEQFEAEGSRPSEVISLSSEKKKSRKPLVIGICSAAAAVVFAVGIGLGLGGGDQLLPHDTPTQEVTSETSETAETFESVDISQDGAIEFDRTYLEGRVQFAQPTQIISTGADIAVASPIDVFTEKELFGYILEFSDYNVFTVHENLLYHGYALDKERSHWNGTWNSDTMPAGSRIGQQVTLCYRKEGAEIKINIGETGENFGYARMEDGYAIRTDGNAFDGVHDATSRLWNSDRSGQMFFYAAGEVKNGTELYCADVNAEIQVFVSTCGAKQSEFICTLAGLICEKQNLTPVILKPFDKTDYESFELCYEEYENPLSDYMLEELFAITDTFPESEPQYDLLLSEGTSYELHCFGKDGITDIMRIGLIGEDFYYSLDDGRTGVKAYYSIPYEAYSAMMELHFSYAPQWFYATVIAEDDIGNTSDPDSGRYLLQDNNGGIYMVHYDEHFEIGSSVEVCFYGGVMESYPMGVNHIWIKNAYNIEADEKPIVFAGMADMGFDTAVFERYFCGFFDMDYASPEVADDPVCYEDEDGYFLGFYNAYEAEVWFVPREQTDIAYRYGAFGLDLSEEELTDPVANPPRCLYADKRRAHEYSTADKSLESGVMNGFGEEKLSQIMGGNFAEVLEEIKSDFTDERGQQWRYHLTNIYPSQLELKKRTDDTAWISAMYCTKETWDDYWDNHHDISKVRFQQFLYTISKDGGEYSIVAREWLNETGAVDLSDDERPVLEQPIEGFDFEIFDDYFLGRWNNGLTLRCDYSNNFQDKAECGAVEGGVVYTWYKSEYRQGTCFIPTSAPDMVYVYDEYQNTDIKRCDYDEVYTKREKANGFGVGELNGVGELRLFDLFGEEFETFYKQLISEDFDDYTISAPENYHRKLAEYLPPDRTDEPYAIVQVKYSKQKYVYAPDTTTPQYVKHTIRLVDGEWQVTESFPCDENGEISDVDAQYNKTQLKTTYTDGGATYYVFLSYYEEQREDGTAITQPLLYFVRQYVNVISNKDMEASITPVSPAWNNTSSGVIPAGSSIELDVLVFDKSDLIEVSIPTLNDSGEVVYCSTLYSFDFDTKSISKVGGENDFYIAAQTMQHTLLADDLFLFMDESGKPCLYRYDREGNAVVEDDLYSYLTAPTIDRTLASPTDFAVAQEFMGTWENNSGELMIDLYNDPFSYAEPCIGFYRDDSGVYMLGEEEVWFIPFNERSLMFRWDSAENGVPLDFTKAEVFTKTAGLSSFYQGEGEMGWLGLMELCAQMGENESPDVSVFFDMEITDENGTRWVRTSDKTVDWGGIYRTSLVDTTEQRGPKNIVLLKMQNAANSSEMRWFSFELFCDKDGTLLWSDTHYCFDMSVFTVEGLPTDYALECKADSESMEFGTFAVSVRFYVQPDGTYYAKRAMGNSGGQWLGSNEVFCYENGSYKQLYQGDTTRVFVGDRLYLARIEDEVVWLDIYDCTQLVTSESIRNGDYNFNIGAYAVMYGAYPESYLHFYLYNAERQSDDIIIWDVSDGAELLGVFTQEELVYDGYYYPTSFGIRNADGTVTNYGE